MAKSRLHQLSELGQSVWIDYLSRDLLKDGELARMMREDAVVGVTSNPTIFQKALSGGSAYDEQLAALLEETDDPKEIFIRLAGTDVGDACDLLRPVWEATSGVDGFVSIEVDPTLAYDTEATTAQAARLHAEIDRPNLFVKIPATKPGLPAIEDMIAKGKSINVTLIFSLDRYVEVAEAYIRGLQRLAAAGGDAPGLPPSPASSSHESTPRPTGGSRRSAGQTSSRARWPSPTRSLRTSGSRSCSPASGGRSSPPRAPVRSGASGPRRRRRIRRTATSSTSRS